MVRSLNIIALHDINLAYGTVDQRRVYRDIRQKLEKACYQAGLSPPPDPTIVSPPSPEALV
jgi:hypothetical protein